MTQDITTVLWVAPGGGLGGVACYSIGTAIDPLECAWCGRARHLCRPSLSLDRQRINAPPQFFDHGRQAVLVTNGAQPAAGRSARRQAGAAPTRPPRPKSRDRKEPE